MGKPDITLVFPKSEFLINDAVFPPLGIMYLSAYLKSRGLDVQCLDMGLGQTPDMAESDTIGISITTPQRNEAFELARYYKDKGCYLVAGGPHATHMPDECMDHGFDRVVAGYGEKELVHILGEYVFWGDLDIDEVPFPDRGALPVCDYTYKIDGRLATPIMTSRGCPFRCSFCAKISDTFMMQSAERTVSELIHVSETYGFDAFMIFDDVFTSSKKRLRKITDLLDGRDFLFRCLSRSHMLDDEVCALLKKLGVVEVGIGVESGSDKILSTNLKGTNSHINKRAIDNLHKVGIRAKSFLIVGLPGETEQTIQETISWIEWARPDDIDVSILSPLPGSSLFKNPEKWGIKISYNGNPQWYKGTPGQYNCNVNLPTITSDRLLYWRDVIEKEYKNPELLQ